MKEYLTSCHSPLFLIDSDSSEQKNHEGTLLPIIFISNIIKFSIIIIDSIHEFKKSIFKISLTFGKCLDEVYLWELSGMLEVV